MPATPLPTTTPTVAYGSRSQPYPRDAEAQVDRIRYKVIKAETRQELPGLFMTKFVAKGKFIVVAVAAVNTGNEPVSIDTPALYDGLGRRFAPGESLSLDLQPKPIFLSETLNPGVPTQFSVVYDVPADASGFLLAVNNGALLLKKEVYIILGF